MILYSGGSSEDGGSAPSESGVGSALVLKKGPWTAAEDEILAAYVREHGEGNWNAVQKNTGLARCGKSCRLRWANHLRPNLKKGAFTPEEERLIIQLHAQLGNKWARMAAQLPGRTDNEIKNYWNTRLKRLQRQGLPLYPPDIIPNHQIQSHRHHQHMYLPPQSQPNTPSSSTMAAAAAAAAAATSSSSFTFQTTTTSPLLRPLSPTPCHTPTTPQTPSRPSSTPPPPLSPTLSSPCQYSTLPLFTLPKSPTLHHDTNAFTFPRPPPLLQPLSMCAKRFNTAHCRNNSSHNVIPMASTNSKVTCSSGMSGPRFAPSPSPLPLAKSSYASFLTQPYSSPATPTAATSKRNINESVALLVSSSPSSTSPIHSFSLNPSSPYHSSSSPNHHMFHTHFTPLSLQSTEPVYSMKPELPSNQMSHSTSLGGVYDVTNLTDNEKHHHHQNHDSDLDRRSSCELLENVLNQAESLDGDGRAPKRRQLMVFPDENNNVLSSFGHCGTSNGICSPQGQKPREDESLQMNVMQEDIAKLLDWGSDSGEISNGHSSVVTDDNLVLDVHQFASLFPVDASAAPNDDHDKNTTSCSWDNLSRIC